MVSRYLYRQKIPKQRDDKREQYPCKYDDTYHRIQRKDKAQERKNAKYNCGM
jgi:hypothetical protein